MLRFIGQRFIINICAKLRASWKFMNCLAYNTSIYMFVMGYYATASEVCYYNRGHFEDLSCLSFSHFFLLCFSFVERGDWREW